MHKDHISHVGIKLNLKTVSCNNVEIVSYEEFSHSKPLKHTLQRAHNFSSRVVRATT